MKVADRFAGMEQSDIRIVMNRALALEARGAEVAHLEIGQPNFDTPEPIKEAAMAALARGETGYGPSAGITPLRAMLARSMSARHHLTIETERVLVTNGASEAIYVALSTVVNPGDEVAILEPCWPNHVGMVKLLGAVVRFISTRAEDDFQPTTAAINAGLSARTKALIVNTPNNPTGSVLSLASMEMLASEARRRNLLIVADEVYDRFLYKEAVPSIACLPDMAARTAIVNAFSKTYAMTGWRLGYVALPTGLVGAAGLTHTYINTSVNTFIQYGALAALSQCETDIERMRESYRQRRDSAIEALSAMHGVSHTVPDGGLFVFPHLGGDDREIARRLLDEANVATVPGSAFGPSGRGHLRISFCASEEVLERGLVLMQRWLEAQR